MKQFIRTKLKSNRNRMSPVVKKVRCPYCPKEIGQRSNMIRHLKKHAEVNLLDLPVTEATLLNCEKKICEGANEKDIECELQVLNEKKLTSEKEKIRCPYCLKEILNYRNMIRHLKNQTGVKPVCSKVFGKRYRLKKHLSTHTSEKRFVCSTCGQLFFTNGGLAKHRKLHIDKKRFLCDICAKGFTQMEAFQQHMMSKHSIEHSLKCPVCSQQLHNHSEYKRHCLLEHDIKVSDTVSHSEEMNGQGSAFTKRLCDTCGNEFKSARLLRTHIRVKHDLVSHSCEVCGKKLSSVTALRLHSMLHTGERPFLCKVCDRTYITNQALEIHMASSHSEDDKSTLVTRFPCNSCDKVFRSAAARKIHSVVHTGLRPFKCNICLKTFSLPGSLKLHYKTHNNHKPHVCNICHVAFRQSSHLKIHILVHTRIKPHACQMCSKAFKNRVDLRYHYTRSHKVTIKKEIFNLRAKYTIELPIENCSNKETNFTTVS